MNWLDLTPTLHVTIRYLPLNGDSDLDDASTRVADAAIDLARPDWLYLATGGSEGVAPQVTNESFLNLLLNRAKCCVFEVHGADWMLESSIIATCYH